MACMSLRTDSSASTRLSAGNTRPCNRSSACLPTWLTQRSTFLSSMATGSRQCRLTGFGGRIWAAVLKILVSVVRFRPGHQEWHCRNADPCRSAFRHTKSTCRVYFRHRLPHPHSPRKRPAQCPPSPATHSPGAKLDFACFPHRQECYSYDQRISSACRKHLAPYIVEPIDT